MKKESVINTKKAIVAALFFGAVSFGYAQTENSAAETVATTQVQGTQQNDSRQKTSGWQNLNHIAR